VGMQSTYFTFALYLAIDKEVELVLNAVGTGLVVNAAAPATRVAKTASFILNMLCLCESRKKTEREENIHVSCEHGTGSDVDRSRNSTSAK